MCVEFAVLFFSSEGTFSAPCVVFGKFNICTASIFSEFDVWHASISLCHICMVLCN